MNNALTNPVGLLAEVAVGIARRHETMDRLALAAAVGTLAAVGVKVSRRATASACGGYDCYPKPGCPTCGTGKWIFACTAPWPCTGGDLCWARPSCAHFCTSFC